MESLAENKELIEYLETFITEARKMKIDAVLAQRTEHITLVLEDIFQPHNTAAVMRSCEGFGIQNLHVIENKYEFEKTKGVAMGSDKWLTINRYNNTESDNTTECLKTLKEKGYKIAASTLREDAIPICELPLDQPIALALGTELSGLSDTAHELSDINVYLPMIGFTQSFNISVCAALSLYDLRTRLNQSDIDWKLSDKERSDLKFSWLKKCIRASDKLISDFTRDRL